MYKGLSYDDEDFHMATSILFSTGWGMSQTAALHPGKPTALILTSASSRTSIAAAFAAKFHKLPLQVIGITSKNHVDFVRQLGTYDAVCSYEEIDSLQKQKVAVQDVAGNAQVREAIYRHFGKDVVYCGAVGVAHVTSTTLRASKQFFGGSPPTQFLVFTAIEEASKIYGQDKCKQLVMDASKAYSTEMRPSFKPERFFGPKSTSACFSDMVEGKTYPDRTYVCSLWPKSLHEPASSKL